MSLLLHVSFFMYLFILPTFTNHCLLFTMADTGDIGLTNKLFSKWTIKHSINILIQFREHWEMQLNPDYNGGELMEGL